MAAGEIEGGKRVSYGARAINEGGWQAIPELAFPGGALIGCSAGFVNVPRIKGSHTAMKSGMLAAEAAFAAIQAERTADTLSDYEESLRGSWIARELKMVRNVEPLVAKHGGTFGTLLAGVDMWMRQLGIGLPFTMRHHADHETLWRKDMVAPISYPKPDGVLTFENIAEATLQVLQGIDEFFLQELNAAMEAARKKGDLDQIGKLQIQRLLSDAIRAVARITEVEELLGPAPQLLRP